MADSRSASGAWSRANSRNRPSPIVSSASERRSQMRRTSVSKIARRRLWSSRSRSNRTSADRPAGSSASILGQVLPVGGELAEHGVAPAVAQQVVVLVEAEGGPEDRVVADEPDEARLDELVERSSSGPRSGAGAGRGRIVLGVDSVTGRGTSRGIGSTAAACREPGRSAVWPGQAVTSGPAATGRGSVSASAARVAAMAVSISAAVTP